ncbi:MAG: type II toxin-antitoxin system HicA family toxin [Actinobacteria bacterium]|nr:type II toxin-antitoxin system HicA family toxin [Actinomycetota bacterium]MBL7123916.1 type II toxin-antitoxin system HicA family toxin [Actinomycetota bacterium]
MPDLPRLNFKEAEKLLLKSGFKFVRTKGSHRIYIKDKKRVVLPFHRSKILHPKIINQLLRILKAN